MTGQRKSKSKKSWYCPIHKKVISEGLCLEINYERLGYFKGANLEDIKNHTKFKTREEINNQCENCANLPI